MKLGLSSRVVTDSAGDRLGHSGEEHGTI